LVFESFVFVVVVVYSTVAPLKTRLSPGPSYLWLTACLPDRLAELAGLQTSSYCKKVLFGKRERGRVEGKARLGLVD
jgi:hypothetical protein